MHLCAALAPACKRSTPPSQGVSVMLPESQFRGPAYAPGEAVHLSWVH